MAQSKPRQIRIVFPSQSIKGNSLQDLINRDKGVSGGIGTPDWLVQMNAYLQAGLDATQAITKAWTDTKMPGPPPTVNQQGNDVTITPPPGSDKIPDPPSKDSMPGWVFPAAAAGFGLLVLSKSKSKSISGMKFGSFKQAGNALMHDGGNVLLMTGGALLSAKFVDLSKIKWLTDNQATNKFAAFVLKHQGGVKAVAGLGIAYMSTHIKDKNMRMIVQFLGYGMAIQGAVQETRVLTAKADGTNFFPALGRNLLLEQGANGTIAGNVIAERRATGTIAAKPDFANMNKKVSGVGSSVGCATYQMAA